MTATKAIRLAPAEDTAANLYNTYHFASQMAALYSRAASLDHRDKGQDIWTDLSFSVVDDIELLYKIWEKAHKLPSNKEDNPIIAGLIVSSCTKSEDLVRLMDIWTPAHKWVSVMQLIEERYRRILSMFEDCGSSFAKAYIKLKEDSLKRTGLIRELNLLYDNEKLLFAGQPVPKQSGEADDTNDTNDTTDTDATDDDNPEIGKSA